MARFNSFSVIALIACFVIVSVAAYNPLQDEQGNPCPVCITTHELLPVCGSNGRTYENPSVLKCHSKCLKSEIKQNHYGICHAGDFLRKLTENAGCGPCIATKEYVPVCGSNGKTYDNKALLKCDAKCLKSEIKVKHEGECA